MTLAAQATQNTEVIIYAFENGADVISLSLETTEETESPRRAGRLDP